MKITKQQLKQLVKEEIKKLSESNDSASYMVDDEVQALTDRMVDEWSKLPGPDGSGHIDQREVERAASLLASEIFDAITKVEELLIDGNFSH